MSLFTNLTKALAPAALLIASNSFASLVPSEPVTIKSITTNGSGCALGTVSQNISEDKTAFTLTFSEFIAEIGPGTAPSLARKNCVATLTLVVPVGWQYSIGSFFFRGFMGLDQGITSTHSTSYFFEGQGKTGKFASVTTGPVQKDFVFTDKVGLASAYFPDTWSSCSAERALNINTAVRVSNSNPTLYPNAQGMITNDSIDGEIKQVFGLTWRRCP